MPAKLVGGDSPGQMRKRHDSVGEDLSYNETDELKVFKRARGSFFGPPQVSQFEYTSENRRSEPPLAANESSTGAASSKVAKYRKLS